MRERIIGDTEASARSTNFPLSHAQPMLAVAGLDTEIDALHVDLIENGAKVREPPSDRPWGNYELCLEDLDDNRFRFAASSVEEDGV